MRYDKIDTLQLVMQPYILSILKAVRGEPLRFNDLLYYCKNSKTLSFKINKLLEYGLIEVMAKKVAGKYANFYTVSQKGKEFLDKIERM